MDQPRNIFSYAAPHVKRREVAPFLPMTREEMERLGWDACDIILITGDAYIDHPSFAMALVGRFLEAQGFRVGIISQPDWRSVKDFKILGRPRLYFGIAAGNMDSMVNHYTAERKIRSDDAYTPGGKSGRRPDRAILVYSQRAREAYPGTTIVIGSIEASLRRVAHYDYWSDTVRRSVLPDSKADILLYGNAERALAELTHRLNAGEKITNIRDLRGTAFMVPRGWMPADDWQEIDSTDIDRPGKVVPHKNPYGEDVCALSCSASQDETVNEEKPVLYIRNEKFAKKLQKNAKTVIRLPSFETVKSDPVLYAHASRIMHLETNPQNARSLVQAHADRDVWLNPPPLPLTTEELDGVYALPYARAPHPSYEKERIPAWEMIRFSISIMRGCFGGCTFCSITEHEGRVIQSRSEASVLQEIEEIRDRTEGFTGIISDLGGPSANMYRMNCRDKNIQALCRRLSCVYPSICVNLNTDHSKLISLYRKARSLPGIKKVFIGSGLRYDLAVRSPEYIRELATHHVGGLLKIAPEHTEKNVLSKMMKPGIGTYEEFRRLFDRFSKEAGKQQYLVPYFIAAHPGTTDEDMLNLALWLKKHNFKLDQVQTFMPTPLSMATTMYHSHKNPLQKVTYESEGVETVRKGQVRRLHKAFLRYHDPENWQLLREWLRRNGRSDLIGNGPQYLVPAWKSAPVRINKENSIVKKSTTKNKLSEKKRTVIHIGNEKAGKFAGGSRHRKGIATRSGRK